MVRATEGRLVTRTDIRGGGRQKDVSEVLQIERVYKNVEKGEFAKAKDLLKAFGTDDQVSAAIGVESYSTPPCSFLRSPPLGRMREHVRSCQSRGSPLRNLRKNARL